MIPLLGSFLFGTCGYTKRLTLGISHLPAQMEDQGADKEKTFVRLKYFVIYVCENKVKSLFLILSKSVVFLEREITHLKAS